MQIKYTKTSLYKKILTSKNTKEICKIVHRILNHSEKILKADRNKLKKYFNETATRLIANKICSKDKPKNLTESFPDYLYIKIMDSSYTVFCVKTLRSI